MPRTLCSQSTYTARRQDLGPDLSQGCPMASNHMTAREFVGREVRRARDAKGLTRAELAKMFPVSVSLVGKWETGRRLPTGRNFQKLVEVLGIGEDVARIIEEIINEL